MERLTRYFTEPSQRLGILCQRHRCKGLMPLKRQLLRFLVLVSFACCCTLWVIPAVASLPGAPFEGRLETAEVTKTADAALEAQARAHYDAGNYRESAELFQRAADVAEEALSRGGLLANAALAYGRLGDWPSARTILEAAQGQIASGVASSPEAQAIVAQVQDIAGQLLLSQGQAESAAVAWEAAAIAYAQADNQPQTWQAQLGQARALQAAGFYRRSIDLLTELITALQAQPPSPLSIQVARNLGEAFRLTGALAQAEAQLMASLQDAEALSLPDEVSVAYRGLGDLARLVDGNDGQAANYYSQAIAAAVSPTIQTQAQLRQLTLSTHRAQWLAAYSLALTLWGPEMPSPLDRPSLYTQIGLIKHLQMIRQATLETLGDLVWAELERLAEAAEQSDTGTESVATADSLAVSPAEINPGGPVPVDAEATFDDLHPITWPKFVQETFSEELATLVSQLAEDYPALPQPKDGPVDRPTREFGYEFTEQQFWAVLDGHLPALSEMAARLASLRQTAQNLGDVQAEASILGALGHLYGQVEDWEAAAQILQEGLLLAQSNGFEQIAYELQAQLGRIQLTLGDRTAAIAAYQASVQTLQAMRADVVAVSSEAQYSFQKSIEPIYRELAALLLSDEAEQASGENLKQAREVIELLQLAELDNFFREACLDAAAIEIDQLDQQAAVIYPILLPNRLAVVISLPGQTFQYFSVAVDTAVLDQTVQDLQRALETPRSDITSIRGSRTTRTGIDIEFQDQDYQVLPLAAQVYDWLVRPAAAALAAADIQTLVFVLDGSLRNIPMAVLYDGSQFLIENYAIALTPGLQLLDPRPLPRQALSVIVAGLSEERAFADTVFGALPNVLDEIDTIEQFFPATVLLNQDFNVENFTQNVGTLPSPVVHLATHGEFGSQLEDTFILTWDDRLIANDFSNILLTSELSRAAPIELLVLSACETATGDDLAVLGLAGIAMRSGARSTLASLWQVSDPATAQLMGEFYRQLGNPDISKAEAIRQAQLSLLTDEAYRHPYYWSPFVLLGNWL